MEIVFKTSVRIRYVLWLLYALLLGIGVFLFNQEKFTVDSYQKIALTHAKHDEQRKAEGGRDKGST